MTFHERMSLFLHVLTLCIVLVVCIQAMLVGRDASRAADAVDRIEWLVYEAADGLGLHMDRARRE